MTGDIVEIMKKNGSRQGEAPSEEPRQPSPEGSPCPTRPPGRAAPPRVGLSSWKDLHLPLARGRCHVVTFQGHLRSLLPHHGSPRMWVRAPEMSLESFIVLDISSSGNSNLSMWIISAKC